jgi:hypothetical protein
MEIIIATDGDDDDVHLKKITTNLILYKNADQPTTGTPINIGGGSPGSPLRSRAGSAMKQVFHLHTLIKIYYFF